MWKASIGKPMEIKTPKNDDNDDDWETDPDFINDVDEHEQRWGSKTVEGSGRQLAAIDMKQLRLETEQNDTALKKKQLEEDAANASYGYGGKFGVQTDRMDQSAVGHDYIAKLEKHASQKDHSTGFGGKFGIQTDRIDKSAENWNYKEKIEKHASQKDYATGFGGKFGVQADRQDKSAVGWDHVEKVDKHESQKDYSVGFGGKFGVQADRQDKSAVGWDHHEKLVHHESQTDHKKGFGGKFGVQTDRMDKSALAFTEPKNIGTAYTKTKPDIGAAKPSDLRAKFENMIQSDPSPKETPEKKSGKLDSSKFENMMRSADPPVKEIQKSGKLDSSKFENMCSDAPPKETPKSGGKLDSSKTAMFANPPVETPLPKLSPVRSIKKVEPMKVEEVVTEERPKSIEIEEIKEEPKSIEVEEIKEEVQIEAKEQEIVEDAELEDTGLVAVALYDYQSAAEDEISFDPEDIITHVEMIDEGWWRGLCGGRYGLFPANYVQLVNKN